MLCVAACWWLTACGPSDSELCEDAKAKVAECKLEDIHPAQNCDDDVSDEKRELYECLADAKCDALEACIEG